MSHKIEILLIEDEEAQYELVDDMLCSGTPAVDLTWASNFSDGLAKLLNFSFDLCLLDYGLDKKNGLELFREARENGCDVPVVFLTAEDNPDVDMGAMKAGAADYLIKTQITCDSLRRCIRYTLERSRLSKEREIYYQAMQGSQHGVIITGRDGEILDVNPAFEQEFGYATGEVKNLNVEIFNPGIEVWEDLGIPPKQYASIIKHQWRQLTDHTVGNWEGEVPRQRKDGSIFWAHMIIKTVFGPGHKPSAFFYMPMDITERRQHEFHVRLECYQALSDLAEKRDNETGAHLKRISHYSEALAEWLLMPKKFVEDLKTFSPLHDIGKVGIPDNILLAPRRLSPEEFEIMKTHTSLGFDILEGRETLEMAAEIARNHHEKWDGSGYPRGLSNEDIPLSARIVALADVYDATRCKRHYKEGWPHEKSRQYIVDSAGSHFDPKVVKAFLEREERFIELSSMPEEEDVAVNA